MNGMDSLARMLLVTGALIILAGLVLLLMGKLGGEGSPPRGLRDSPRQFHALLSAGYRLAFKPDSYFIVKPFLKEIIRWGMTKSLL